MSNMKTAFSSIESLDLLACIIIAGIHIPAVRMKRVSRAGSSHKPRVMNKNKGNSRAGQTDDPATIE
uniref:Secreted protein n=1 Tax=Heterorhabditis bacteriophora TaxID=37862 RepID=A0A1I7WUU9_HETBA